MTAFNTDRPVGVPMTPQFWKPNLEINVDGDWQYEGSTPGFWTTTWRSQVSGNIDNGWFGDAIGAITSPFQLYDAKTAPGRIYSGIMSDYPEELKTLQAIEQDNTKTGKDWYNALPKDIKDQMESLDIVPINQDSMAYEFANDVRQTLAWAIYGRDVSRGYEQHNDFALLGANIGLGVVTDPTSLISFGAGSAANSTSLLSKFGFKSTLALNAGLAVGQTAESLIQRDYMSERLGITPGDLTAFDVSTEVVKTGAIALATGAGLYGAGYATSMGLSKFNRKISAKAEELAKGLTNNPNVLSNADAENVLLKINNGINLKPKEQAAILAETLNVAYGTRFDASVWDWDAMDAVGVRPIDLAKSVAEQGYSGKQIQDILNYAYKVLDDANEVHVAPVGPQVPTLAENPPVFTVDGPVLPTRQLPDFMVEAGYTWDPIGKLVKDPSKAPTSVDDPTTTSTTTIAPVKQPLLPEVIDPIVPPKASAGQVQDPVVDLLATTSTREEFISKLADIVSTLNKEQRKRGVKLAHDDVHYAEYKALLKDYKPSGPKISNEDLVAAARSLSGREDTLVTLGPSKKDSAYMLEVPNLVDRLVWMTGNSWESKGSAEKLLNDYYGLGIKEIRERRRQIQASIESLKKGRAKIDRIQVVRNPDGSYSSTILRMAQDPQVGLRGQRLSRTSPEALKTKAERYADKRNAAVDRALQRKQDAFNEKLNKALNTPKKLKANLTVPGLDRESTLAYNQMINKGHLVDAYNLLKDELVGPGNFPEIIKLSSETKTAQNDLTTALRTGTEEEINKAKAKFDKINSELSKYKQRLFAVSDNTKFGKLRLIKPLDATKGPLSARQLGTPFAPASQFYVEPIGIDNDATSHQAVLLLQRAFANADPINVASRIDIDIPEGYFAKVADAMIGLNSSLFFQSDTGRLLLNKQPILGHLVNAVAPSRLMNAGDLGSTHITPSNETMHLRNQTEGFAVIKSTIDKLRELGIYVNTPEMDRAVYDAMVERHHGVPNASTKYRAATDIIKSEFFSYYDKVSAEGVAVGKIKQVDSTYTRTLLNQNAHHDIEGVNTAFFKSFVEWLMKDESPIHKETLESLTSVKLSEEPIKTLKDLRAANPDIANQYVDLLQKADKKSRAYQQVTKMIRVKMGLDVTDDISIIRESDHYMNSGFGKTIDAEILLNPNMRQYINTDLSHMMDEYNRNVRYYISRQEVTNRLVANLTGEDIKGVTWNDLLKYVRSTMYDHYPEQQKDIDMFFDSLVAKEAQITGRGRQYKDHELVLDAAMALAASPVQSAVVAGISTTSSLAESAKMVASSIMTSLHGTGGSRTFLGTMGRLIRQMSKPDIMASMSAMMQVQTHGMLREIDRPITNYAGGYYLPTKIANVRRAFQNVYDAARSRTDTRTARFSNVAKSIAGAFVEPVKQLAHIDNITAVNYRAYHSQGMFKMAGVLEQFMKDPNFFKNAKRNEIVNRLEEAGLFSEEARNGLRMFLKKKPDLIYGYFEMNDLANTLIDIRTDPTISNEAASAAQMFYTAFWGAAERYADSRIMTTARIWDQANPSVSPALNRLFNTFSGYSRWFFSRQMLQNFPNSKMHKIGALLGWYVTAEAISMLLRDALLDFNKFEQMIDSEDDDIFETYMGKAVLRVPLFGQLTNGTYSIIAEAHDLFVPSDDQWTKGNYRSPSMFSGNVYYTAAKEIGKAARGEDYDPEKIRKAAPYFSAPIFGGLLKAASE